MKAIKDLTAADFKKLDNTELLTVFKVLGVSNTDLLVEMAKRYLWYVKKQELPEYNNAAVTYDKNNI